jgi:hypothetical protein
MTFPADITLAAAVPNSPGAVDGDTAEELISAEIAALRQTIAELTATNALQASQLIELAGPVTWLALLACDRGGYTAEAVRQWCIDGKVEAYQEKGSRHWFVNTRSLGAHLARLGLAKAIRRP